LGFGFRRTPEPPTFLEADLDLLDRIGRADCFHRATQTRVDRLCWLFLQPIYSENSRHDCTYAMPKLPRSSLWMVAPGGSTSGFFAALGNPFFLHTRDQHRKTSVGYDYGKFIVVAICQCGLASNRGAAPLAGGGTNVVANKSRGGTYSRSTTRQFYHSGNAVRILTIKAADNRQKGRNA
jgi:hypothetical protein